MRISSQLILTCALTFPSTSIAQSVSATPDASDGVKPPVFIRMVNAKFPKHFLGKQKHSEVLISYVVDENGLPKDLTVEKAQDSKLADAALEAVGKYRFKPATQNGVPVKYKLLTSVDFEAR